MCTFIYRLFWNDNKIMVILTIKPDICFNFGQYKESHLCLFFFSLTYGPFSTELLLWQPRIEKSNLKIPLNWILFCTDLQAYSLFLQKNK